MHSGGHFIPWDDDFDICIFEEDYEKAIDCLTNKESGLSDGIQLQCTRTDPNYYLGWMKVRDQYSHTYPDAPRFKENGVWIDLYKLVKAKNKDVAYLKSKEAIDYLDRRLNAGGLTREEYMTRMKQGNLKGKLDEARKASEQSIDEGMSYIIWSASKIALKENWVEPLKTVVFEGIPVTTFGCAEEYLISHYGSDYATYPSDELRRVGLNRIDILKVTANQTSGQKNEPRSTSAQISYSVHHNELQ